jgi:hypothetical protein
MLVSRAKEGACLATLINLAKPFCLAAECECPRQGPGRPPQIADWTLALLIMVAVICKKKSKSAQYRFIDAHRKELASWIGVKRLPRRSTYFERYKRAHKLFEVAIRLQGQAAVREKIADASVICVDKSMIAAQGPRWHRCHRRRNVVPKNIRGIDRDSAWGISAHDGWVQGYSYEIAVSAAARSIVFPLLASADTAAARESSSFGPKIQHLPRQTRHVLSDSGYDTNDYGERIELDAQGRRTSRHFICTPNPRNPSKGVPQQKSRRIHWRWRQKRLAYYRSRTGRRLFKRRCQSVEPANEWFKVLFELTERVWHRGLSNNQTQLLAAIFAYQVLVRFNCRRGRRNGQVKWILDTL